MKKIIVVVLLSLLALSCSNNRKFIEEFNKVMSEKQGEELLPALLELDGKYPEKLRTKINLAAIYLGSGDTEKAETYLASGLAAAEKSRDKDEKYIYYSNYSEYLLKQSNFAEAIKYGNLALENGEEDPMGVSLTVAQALTAEKKYPEALIIYKNMFNKNVQLFSENDLITFMSLLGASQEAQSSIAVMISIIDEIRLRNPALQGAGLKQAELLEQSGAPISALVAAFSEFEYARYAGSMDSRAVMETLDILSKNIGNKPQEEKLSSIKMIDGYRSFVQGQWGQAEAAFTELVPEVPVVFYEYLLLASRMQTGLGSGEVFSRYALLERNYSALQGYYYHLWNGMKKGAGEYNSETASDILKNCILVSPASSWALESRIELGKINGIADGKNLLLVDEIFYYINAVIEGAPQEILEPAAVMLEMEDNVFVDDAMALLKEAVKEERIAVWLKERAKNGNSRIRERAAVLFS